MRVTDIVWLDDIVEKLQWKHNIIREEVHEVSVIIRMFDIWKKVTGMMKMFMLPMAGVIEVVNYGVFYL